MVPRNVFKSLACFAAIAVLAGCAPPPNPQLASIMPGRTITVTEVVLAPDARMDELESLDGSTEREKAPAFLAAVKHAIDARLPELPQGRSPTLLKVTVTALTIATDEGNFLGSMTGINANPELYDIQTNQKVASLGSVAGARTTSSPLVGGIGGMIVREAMDAGRSRMQVAADELADQIFVRLKAALKPETQS